MKKMGSKMLSQKSVMRPPAEKSAQVHIAAGSGSRPTPSRHKIMTTQPSDQKGLDGRKTKNALK